MTFDVKPYEAAGRAAWDGLVGLSRNGTFLHRRDFMEYHADRFVDASLMVYEASAGLIAVMPANRDGDRIVSHGGLTYGGLIFSPRLRQAACLEALGEVVSHCRYGGASKLVYKAVPYVFQKDPGQEDLYALSRLGARISRRDVSTVVDLQREYRFTKGRTWAVNKGRKAGLGVRRVPDPSRFHALLVEVLGRHGASPVHSLDELRLLMQRFPEEILLYEAIRGDELLAATLIFDFGHAVHTQYLAGSAAGRELGAMDFLLAELMKQTFAERRYFSFGISTEAGGTILNEGLIAQKEGFGGSSVCHDFYELDLR